jgi:hypothetical protein
MCLLSSLIYTQGVVDPILIMSSDSGLLLLAGARLWGVNGTLPPPMMTGASALGAMVLLLCHSAQVSFQGRGSKRRQGHPSAGMCSSALPLVPHAPRVRRPT